MKKRLTVQQASEAVDHAETMLSRAETNCGIDGLDCVSQFDRAVRRCPAHFNWAQRLLAQKTMLAAYMRAIGRC